MLGLEWGFLTLDIGFGGIGGVNHPAPVPHFCVVVFCSLARHDVGVGELDDVFYGA